MRTQIPDWLLEYSFGARDEYLEINRQHKDDLYELKTQLAIDLQAWFNKYSQVQENKVVPQEEAGQ